MPEDFQDKIFEVFKPMADMLEPYKVADFTHERGIPALHEELGK